MENETQTDVAVQVRREMHRDALYANALVLRNATIELNDVKARAASVPDTEVEAWGGALLAAERRVEQAINVGHDVRVKLADEEYLHSRAA
jgi:hypothetical protein